VHQAADHVGKRSREINVAVALAHLTLTVALVLWLVSDQTSEWAGFVPFAILIVIDLPLSLLDFLVGLESLTPTRQLLLFGAVHCLAGTVWYYHVPTIFRLRWNS